METLRASPATRSSSSRRSSTCRTRRRCSTTSAHAPPRRHRLRLDAERADARARGRREVGQPVARQGVPRGGVPRAVRGSLRPRRAARPLPRAQAARCTSWRSRAGWDRVHAALGITKRFYDWFTPAISARDFALRAGPLDRALDFVAVLQALSRPRQAGALALVLHSHMPYVEGFGTWPFGEEWLWEAVACVLPAAARRARRRAGDGRADAGAVRPARGDARRRRRALPPLPARRCARRSTPRTRAGLDDSGRAASSRPRCAARPSDYTRADAALRGARPRPRVGVRGARAASSSGRPPRRTRCCRCWPPTPALRLQVATGIGGARAPLRRLGRRLLAARVRLRARARARPGRARRARLLRRPDRRAGRALDHLEPVATETGPVAVPIDWETVQLVWGDGARLPGARAATATTTGRTRPRPEAVEQRRRAVRPRRARSSSRASTRATSCGRARRRDARRAAASLCCALDTELLGHWWYEGLAWLARRARGGRRARACGSSRCRRARAGRAGGAPAGAVDLGARRRTSRPGTRRARGRDRLRRRAPRSSRTVAAVAAHGRAARRARARGARAARAAVERLGVPGHARPGGRLPARSACARHAAALRRCARPL